MTNKRFEYLYFDDGTEGVYDTEKKKYFFGFDDVVDLLNNLVKEYEFDYLHTNCRCMPLPFEMLQSKIKRLEEENEQLKSTITHLEEECGAREYDYVNLKKQLDKIPPKIKEVWING